MERLGRYELIAPIGSGGMADVFLARLIGAEGFSRQLVVKRMRPELSARKDAVRMFLDEARICSSLFHPNLVQVFDLGQVEDTYFIAMEFVDGPHLGRLVRHLIRGGEKLPLVLCTYIVHGVALGLHHAHEAKDPHTGQGLGIVHRDISPHNILVSRFGDVKVVDFGVAKATGRKSETKSGVVKGKVFYMSPEQVLGDDIDRRSDIFSLGIVLFEIATGRRLFKQKSDLVSMQLITQEDAPSASAFNPDVDDELAGIIARSLRRNREERTPTMEALAAELATWISRQTQKHLQTELGDWVSAKAEVLIPSVKLAAEGGIPPVGGVSPIEGGPGSDPLTSGEATLAETLPSSDSSSDEGIHSQVTHVARKTQTKQALNSQKGDDTGSGTNESSNISLSTRAFEKLKTNLAPHGARFVGRKAALSDIDALFAEGARIVTLIGPGGTGKTRLALRYAEKHLPELSKGGGGAWFVDLTNVDGLGELCAKVGEVLGVPLTGQGSADSLAAHLGRAIAGRGRMLLVLDNFERLVAHGPKTVAQWQHLAPDARFIVTSREVLRLDDEAAYEVAPLSLPGPDVPVHKAEAVQLFVDRAKKARPGFALADEDAAVVAEIVAKLDGLPLAIELAAARMRVLRPKKILDRLSRRFDLLRGGARDLSPRQATLRGTLDWSWDLLEPVEQTALTQSAVFRGGFSLEAAEEVLALGDDAPWPLDVVQALRDKSLLRSYEVAQQASETRFSMYESVREYAQEKLDETGRGPDAEARHAAYFLDAGTSWAAQVPTKKGKDALIQLTLERQNIMAVANRAVAQRDKATAVSAALILAPLFSARGPFADQIELLDKTLALPGDIPVHQLVEAHLARGRARRRLGRIADSRADFAEALKLSVQNQREDLEGVALRDLGVLALDEGRLDDAERNFQDALEKNQRTQAVRDEGECRAYIAFLYDERGEPAAAEPYYQEALRILREVGDLRTEALVHGNYGGLKQEQGNPDAAQRHYEEALQKLSEVGDRTFEGPFLGFLGIAAHNRGSLGEAVRHLERSIAVMRETGNLRYEGLMLGYLGAALAASDDPDRAEAVFGQSDERNRVVGDPRHIDCGKLQRGFLELCLARSALSAGNTDGARALIERVERRLKTAKAPGEDGGPSAYARSDEVRRIWRMLTHDLERSRPRDR